LCRSQARTLISVWITLTGLIKPHLCVCPKQEPWYPSAYVVVFFVFNDLRCEVVGQVVDNGGIVDHLFSNFLFIEWSKRISRNSNDYLKASCLNYAYWSFRKFKFLNSNLQTASISISWNTELNLQGFLTQVEDSHDITEILLKVALNIIKPTKTIQIFNYSWMSEPISSVKYDNKTPQNWRQNLLFFGMISIVKSNYLCHTNFYM
jgi:hypothetical protein